MCVKKTIQKHKEELFRKFNEIYLYYWDEINKFNLVKIISTYYLSDFPDNLSDDIKLPIEFIITYFQGMTNNQLKYREIDDRTIEFYVPGTDKTKIAKISEEIPILEFILGIASQFEDVEKDGKRSIELKETLSKDFIEILNSQIITLLYAYFDSFLAECMYYILKIKSDIWENKKIQLTYLESQKDDLEEQFIEKYINQHFSREPTYKQIRIITNKIESKIDQLFDKDRLKLLEESEQVRHLIVHNFGKINSKFKSLIATELDIGEKFPITKEYTDKILHLIVGAMLKLFEEIAIKLFGKTKKDILLNRKKNNK